MNLLNDSMPQARLKAERVSGNEKAHVRTTHEPFLNQLNRTLEFTVSPTGTQRQKCRRCRRGGNFLHLIASQTAPAHPVTVARLCQDCIGKAHTFAHTERQQCSGCGNDLSNFVEVHGEGDEVVCDDCYRYRPRVKLIGAPNDRFRPRAIAR